MEAERDRRHLISADELMRERNRWRLFDARSGQAGRTAYQEAHLEGALHVDLDQDLAAPPEDPSKGGRHPLPAIGDWSKTLGRLGITPDTRVVVYDDQGGANAAARLWWMLRASGHQRVAVLDGGLDAAVEAGFPTSAEAPEVESTGLYPVDDWRSPTSTIEEVERARSDSRWTVVDVRSSERFRGEEEPFDPVKGHIPGAVNLPYFDLLDDQGRFRSSEEIAGLLDETLGASGAESQMIVHCGSGVTACHTLLAMELAGRPGARLYIGSWSEWCRARPEAIGPGPFRAVIFDLGGVVLGSPLHAIAAFEEDHGIPRGFINLHVVDSAPDGAWHRLERGEISMGPEFFDAFDQELSRAGQNISTEAMMERIAENSQPRPNMLSAIAKLRTEGLTVAALTNNWNSSRDNSSREDTDKSHALMELFDHFIESSVVGLRKPDPQIYLLACRRIGIEPREAVFLDDIGSNLKTARKLGMTTIKVVDPESALAELSAVLGIAL